MAGGALQTSQRDLERAVSRIAFEPEHRHFGAMIIKRKYIYWFFASLMVGVTVAMLVFYNLAGSMEVQRRGFSFLIGSASVLTTAVSCLLFYIGWQVRGSDD
jgi:hypothetical protein